MKKLLIVALLLASACSQGEKSGHLADSAKQPGQLLVYTVNYPLAWMARQLAGEVAQVEFPAPEGVDPAFWQPDTDTILRYQQADLVLLNGANYAKWAGKVSLPANRLLDTSTEYRDQLLPVKSGPVHSHGPEGEHSHGELAFTTWLNLDLAGQQAAAVASALVRMSPSSEAGIKERLLLLQARLQSMDAQMQALGEQLASAPLLYSHPVYQYLQDRYQLNGRAVHWEPDVDPGEEEWRALETLLQAHPARLMLWEAKPLPQVAGRLDELGVAVVVFAPMGNRPDNVEFDEGMAANIVALASAVGSL